MDLLSREGQQRAAEALSSHGHTTMPMRLLNVLPEGMLHGLTIASLSNMTRPVVAASTPFAADALGLGRTLLPLSDFVRYMRSRNPLLLPGWPFTRLDKQTGAAPTDDRPKPHSVAVPAGLLSMTIHDNGDNSGDAAAKRQLTSRVLTSWDHEACPLSVAERSSWPFFGELHEKLRWLRAPEAGAGVSELRLGAALGGQTATFDDVGEVDVLLNGSRVWEVAPPSASVLAATHPLRFFTHGRHPRPLLRCTQVANSAVVVPDSWGRSFLNVGDALSIAWGLYPVGAAEGLRTWMTTHDGVEGFEAFSEPGDALHFLEPLGGLIGG